MPTPFVINLDIAKADMQKNQSVDRIGAINVRIRPKPDALPGQFVVTGVWAYSESSMAALRVVLEEQRALYRERPISIGVADKPGVRAALRRLISGRRKGG